MSLKHSSNVRLDWSRAEGWGNGSSVPPSYTVSVPILGVTTRSRRWLDALDWQLSRWLRATLTNSVQAIQGPAVVPGADGRPRNEYPLYVTVPLHVLPEAVRAELDSFIDGVNELAAGEQSMRARQQQLDQENDVRQSIAERWVELLRGAAA